MFSQKSYFFGTPNQIVLGGQMFGVRPLHSGGTPTECCPQTAEPDEPNYVAPCCLANHLTEKQRTGGQEPFFKATTFFN